MVRPERREWYRIKNAATDDDPPEILIYDEIDSWFGVAASDLVRDVAKISAPEIVVRINSIGGDVFDGIAILNALRGHDAKITIIVDGLAASIASVIAMAGDRIIMNRNSEMMLHNASALCVGDAADMQKTADMLAMQNDNIASIYAGRAGGTVEEWRAVMDEETWLTAEEAVEAGLADQVGESDDPDAVMRAAAAFDRSRFRYPGRKAAPAPRIAARAQARQPVEAEKSERKEPTVASLNESALQKLGLDADADEGAVEAAINSLAERADKPAEAAPQVEAPAAEPTAEEVTKIAAKYGLTVVDKAVHDSLTADVKELKAIREQQIRAANDQLISDALRVGKIAPASKENWQGLLESDRDRAVALLATLPANSVPVTERGHAGVAGTVSQELGGDGPDQGVEHVHNQVLARLGIAPQKGNN